MHGTQGHRSCRQQYAGSFAFGLFTPHDDYTILFFRTNQRWFGSFHQPSSSVTIKDGDLPLLAVRLRFADFAKRELPRIISYVDHQKQHHAAATLFEKMERCDDGYGHSDEKETRP
jgi:hypothetical protein